MPGIVQLLVTVEPRCQVVVATLCLRVGVSVGFLVGQPARRFVGWRVCFGELVLCGCPSGGEVARRAGVSTTTGESWFGAAGGVRPRLVGGVEAGGRGRWLSECEREHIALRLAEGAGVRQIARELGPGRRRRSAGRSRATGSPGTGTTPMGGRRGGGRYRGLLAPARARMRRRRRPKHRKFVQHSEAGRAGADWVGQGVEPAPGGRVAAP